ncbi:MAG: transcription-repair coupling factor [Eubacteriales bacterium]|nr:transcription-repair coupling factor [Eubacteriales bacterium]
MNDLTILSRLIDGMEEYKNLIDYVQKGVLPTNVVGVSETAAAHLIFCVWKKVDRPVLVVCSDGVMAQSILQDVNELSGEGEYFPDKEYIFHDVEASFKDITGDRIKTIDYIAKNKSPFVVTTVNALLQPTLPKEDYENNSLVFEVGQEVPENYVEKFVSMGYVREESVEGKGQFAVRGGIIDFFPLSGDEAYRVELWNTDVDSIRVFDVLSQRSLDKVDIAEITPSREIILSEEKRDKLIEVISKNKIQSEILVRDKERLEQGIYFPSLDRYIPAIYDTIPTIADYMENAVIFWVEPKRIAESYKASKELTESLVKNHIEREAIPKMKGAYSYSYHSMISRLEGNIVGVSAISHQSPDYRPLSLCSINSKAQSSFHGSPELFFDAVKYYKNIKYCTIILAGSNMKASHITDELTSNGIMATYKSELTSLPAKGEVFVTAGELAKGFEYPIVSVALITDKEIFGSRKRTAKKPAKSNQQRIMSYSDLNVGDYVVHQAHGIGKFVGMKQLEIDGAAGDYLQIQYSGTDTLYIPTTQLDSVYKYIGKDSSRVKLNKLNGTEWLKTKVKVKKACVDMADQLIALYSARQNTEGHAFSADNEWQMEFEDAFPYEETDDQLRCITEVKSDMEKTKPMDRLLCGDVGYGKTEVALRAAFKAVNDGYQVVYLVPTTILANQHFNTFLQRMAQYPIKVEMLSRFRSPTQQKKIIKQLAGGEIDIAIGTHKLLSSEIKYKKLGLLIIDEEQRFGVAHKEKIKEMKNNVDVLTLTATPIPRTLHMSLVGIRDMSVIEQPPQNRYPVATFVMEYDFSVISEAILKEVSRGGQVYYLHNNTKTIYRVASRIQEISPDLRIAVAHGKMNETELENVMEQVINNSIDVLVCTTIVETGLDIANVNTIIIEDADRMGLSQLYQLRGRVGRSSRLAYAYLTYRKDKVMNEDAQKRLKAIKEFTEFGSGFKIALRDLEIRGAGNVIGAQQHGHMDAVGYDLFCRLLSEAVAERRGDKLPASVETSIVISIPVDAYIPKNYIHGENYRIEMYKKIAAITDEAYADDVYEEIEDRYGDLPATVRNLIDIAVIRAYAEKLGMVEVSAKGNNLVMSFEEGRKINLLAIADIMNEYKGKLLFSAGNKPFLTYRGYSIARLIEIKKLLNKFVKFAELAGDSDENTTDI